MGIWDINEEADNAGQDAPRDPGSLDLDELIAGTASDDVDLADTANAFLSGFFLG